MTTYCHIKTPSLGDILLTADATHLTGLYFYECDHAPASQRDWVLNPAHPVLKQTLKQLQDYLDGRATRFSVPIRTNGTDFQQRVWEEIALIPYGETITYSELARRAGKPEAIRAVGTATGKNRIGVIIPCHRVVGKNGSFGGYAGGLHRKHRLLELEQTIN